MKRLESAFEHVLFSSRWLMAPVYLGLMPAMDSVAGQGR